MGEEEDSEGPTSWSTPGAHGTDGTRKRRSSSSGRKESAKASENHSSTADSDAIKNIRQCKNYYEILGVAQDCTEDDLKKAYKKLALKYHPDKNHTAGATEAFKAISNAFSVLNDPEKRKRYDQYGSEEEQSVRQRSHGEYDFTRGFEGDISAEDLFNMFFGSGFQMAGGSTRMYYRPRTQYRYQRYYQHRHPAAGAEEEGIGMHRLLPLLIIIVLMMLTNLLRSDPPYTMHHTTKYNIERRTGNLGVLYYVKSDFSETYKGSIGKLEAQVEEDYVTNLRSACYKERMYKESLMWQARSYRNSRLYEQAQGTTTPSCDRLQEIYGG